MGIRTIFRKLAELPLGTGVPIARRPDMLKLKCYYAHCKSIYDTPQEARDVALLAQLGFEVVNPNSMEISKQLKEWQKVNHAANRMEFFTGLVGKCDLVAFRGLPYTWDIPAGVYEEVLAAGIVGLPTIELPTALLVRGLDVKETREYLHEVGQR